MKLSTIDARVVHSRPQEPDRSTRWAPHSAHANYGPIPVGTASPLPTADHSVAEWGALSSHLLAEGDQ